VFIFGQCLALAVGNIRSWTNENNDDLEISQDAFLIAISN
jgi:hypothetical protein